MGFEGMRQGIAWDAEPLRVVATGREDRPPASSPGAAAVGSAASAGRTPALPSIGTEPPLLEVAGQCPGPMTLRLTGVGPGVDVAIMSSIAEGPDIIAFGPCAGHPADLVEPLPRTLRRRAKKTVSFRT